MNQVILFQLMLNLLNKKQVLQKLLTMLMKKLQMMIDNPSYNANKVGKNKTEIVIPLKYLRNFWRSLNILLINCEVELILTWTKNCALADMTVANSPPFGLEFEITKLYVPVVTLSKENDIKLLEKLKSGFKKILNGTNIDHK